MHESFGAAAAELSGAAAALLGWRPDDFWSSTPLELALALEPPAARLNAPDSETIADLRKRFPDD